MIPLTKPYEDKTMKKGFLAALRRSRIDQCTYIERFTKHFSSSFSLPYGLCVNSGTNALILGLYGVGIRHGDKVAIPGYTCKAVLDAVMLIGAKPVFIDSSADYKNSNFNFDEDDFFKKYTPDIKALILPYMFGKVTCYKKLSKIHIPIIEDVTLSLGAEIDNFKNRKRIVVCSFHSSKMISSVEGGMIATNDKTFYNTICIAADVLGRNREERMRPQSEIQYDMTFSFRPSELNFTWGYMQLRRIEQFIRARRKIARVYCDSIDREKYEVPEFDSKNIYYRFIVGTRNVSAEVVIRSILRKGIEAGRGVYPLLTDYIRGQAKLHNAERAIHKSISVPIYPGLSYADVKTIINTLNGYNP